MMKDVIKPPDAASQAAHKQFYRRHYQAAVVQARASMIMWLFALAAYLIDLITHRHFIGVSLGVLYLVAINPPTLWVLKHIQDPHRRINFSTFINLLEIIGYTAVIYFLGGIEATYLTIIYAAMIAYVGVVSSRQRTFLITGMCIAVYAAMILLEGTGLIPWFKVIPDFHLTWPHRLARMFVVAGLMLVIAYITSYTANLLRKTRDELRASHRHLEIRVAERTADLSRSNDQLHLEVQERISTEKSLKEAHETFLTVLESIDANIYVADLQTHEILYMNRHIEELFGGEALGSRCWDVFRNASGPCPHCTMQKLLDQDGKPTGVHVWETENPITRRWYINYDRAIKWVDGRWVFLQIATDITDLKTLEKERSEAEAKLHRAQKMEALGQLAGGVAHDLNNILSGIVSYPELMLLDLPEEHPLRKPLEVIKKSGDKAAAIVTDLLDLARRAVVTMEIVNLNTIVQDYVDSPEHANLKEYHPKCDLKVDCQPGLMNIAGAPLQLNKSIMNLVSNAFEAMTEGGQAVLSTENCYVDRSIGGFEDVIEGEYVLLTVADEGTGISDEDKERIFEPFFTKKVMGRSGTGLGMAVVWGAVKDHNGFIDVQSTLGESTTFRLYFPVSRQPLHQQAAKPQLDELQGRGQSILVVDDVEDQRVIACGILKKLGYRPNAVASGEASLAYLKENKVDLMLIDMIMDPGMNGLDTFQAARKIRPHQKAVIASGFAETKDVKTALLLGASTYVRKPYSIEQIGQALKDVFDHHSAG